MAGKGKACSSVSDKQAEAIKKSVYKGFRTLGINTGGISYVSIEAALNKLMSEKGYTIEVLFTSEHKQELINTIAQARRQCECRSGRNDEKLLIRRKVSSRKKTAEVQRC